jgi:hypothetical protein
MGMLLSGGFVNLQRWRRGHAVRALFNEARLISEFADYMEPALNLPESRPGLRAFASAYSQFLNQRIRAQQAAWRHR